MPIQRIVILPDPGQEEKSCLTCRNSPPYPGRSGCYLLNGAGANDGPLAKYCEESGANDDDSPEQGWPRDRSVVCPAWAPRLEYIFMNKKLSVPNLK